MAAVRRGAVATVLIAVWSTAWTGVPVAARPDGSGAIDPVRTADASAPTAAAPVTSSWTFAPAAPADLPPSLSLAGVLGGPSHAVASAPPYLFLAVGPRIVVLDATDVLAPVEVGATAVLPGTVVAIAHNGDRLYAGLEIGAGTAHRLCIIDLAELAGPAVGGCASLLALPEAIAVAGDHAFVASGEAGLDILDVSNPFLPQRAATFATTSPARDVVVAGARAFVAVDSVIYFVDGIPNTAPGVVMVDVADPLAPADAGVFNRTIPDSLQLVDRLRVRGDRAYAVGAERASVYDVSDPDDPLLLGQASLARSAGARLALGDDELWLVHPPPAAGATRVDIADPVEPRVTHAVDAPHAEVEWSGTAAGDDLVAATRLGGYAVVTPLDPPAASVSDGLTAIGQAADVDFAADRIVVAARQRGLAVIDVADPTAPRMLAGADAGEPGRDAIAVAVYAGYAYLLTVGGLPADTRLELYELPIAGDAPPAFAGTRVTAAGARALAVHAGHLYVAGDDFEVLDVGDPAAPEHLDSLPLSTGVETLALWGDHAYLGGNVSSILPIDISDPARPIERAGVAVQGSVAGLATAGSLGGAGTLFAAYRGRGLAVFDLTDPAAPAASGGVPDFGRLWDVALGAGRPWLLGPAHLVSPDPAALADGARYARLDLPIAASALAVTDALPGLAVAVGDGIALIALAPGVEPTATHTPAPDPDPTTPAAPTPGDPTATAEGSTATPTPDGTASPGPTVTEAAGSATPTVDGATAGPPTPTPEGTGASPAPAVYLPWSRR